jgi:hypothetical protein
MQPSTRQKREDNITKITSHGPGQGEELNSGLVLYAGGDRFK